MPGVRYIYFINLNTKREKVSIPHFSDAGTKAESGTVIYLRFLSQ